MNKKQPFKSIFSPMVGVFLTILLFGIEQKFPLYKMIENSPKGASWIDLAWMYWVYFALYNGHFFLKKIIFSFSEKNHESI
jgi:hypothetical protein